MTPQEKEYYAAVGANMRALRLSMGYSQEQMGEIWDVTFQQVQKYEKGHNRPPLDKLIKLCEMAKVDIGDVLRGAINFDIPASKNSSTLLKLLAEAQGLSTEKLKYLRKTVKFLKGDSDEQG